MNLAAVPPGDIANGFGMALGFIAFLFVVSLVALGIDDEKLKNPFGPFVRWTELWLNHRFKMTETRLQYKLRRQNPEWTEFLEKREDE